VIDFKSITVPKSDQKVFSLAQSAKMAGISEEILALWVSTGKFKPSIELKGAIPGQSQSPFGYHRFSCTEQDIEKLRALAEQTAEPTPRLTKGQPKEHVKGTDYTVQELANLWQFSPDKVRELFENEPDVLKIKNPAKKGKRAYTTLRIPESVAERASRRLSK
jgi:hypothetical protein